jgi:hypothetical protein
MGSYFNPQFEIGLSMTQTRPPLNTYWSVVAEWLGRRSLNQRVVGSRSPLLLHQFLTVLAVLG